MNWLWRLRQGLTSRNFRRICVGSYRKEGSHLGRRDCTCGRSEDLERQWGRPGVLTCQPREEGTVWPESIWMWCLRSMERLMPTATGPASLVSIHQIAMERNFRDSHLKGQALGKAIKEEENSTSWQEMQRQWGRTSGRSQEGHRSLNKVSRRFLPYDSETLRLSHPHLVEQEFSLFK